MDEMQKNWFMVAWPIVLVFGSALFQVGGADSRINELEASQRETKNLVSRVAVLEARGTQFREDLSEIKSDVKFIREYLLNPKDD